MEYNDWTVLKTSTQRKYFLLCCCVCGTVKDVRKCSLIDGTSKSCGCRKFRLNEGSGYVGTRTYNCYVNMRQRCKNKNNPNYHRYGGRGITVCNEWDCSFKSFLKDMGLCPSNKHSIERIRNNEGYKKNNCKWATRDEQSRNTRKNILITFNEETMTQLDWSLKLFNNRHTVRSRMQRGWTAERALTTPHTDAQNKCHARRITFNEETHTVSQWAKMIGLPNSTMKHRLRTMTIEKALTTPPRTKRNTG